MFEGDFAKSLNNYEISIPRKVTKEGHRISHSVRHLLPTSSDPESSRRRRWRRDLRSSSPADDDRINYSVTIDGKELHLDLVANHALFAPGLVVERRDDRATQHTPTKLTTACLESDRTDATSTGTSEECHSLRLLWRRVTVWWVQWTVNNHTILLSRPYHHHHARYHHTGIMHHTYHQSITPPYTHSIRLQSKMCQNFDCCGTCGGIFKNILIKFWITMQQATAMCSHWDVLHLEQCLHHWNVYTIENLLHRNVYTIHVYIGGLCFRDQHNEDLVNSNSTIYLSGFNSCGCCRYIHGVRTNDWDYHKSRQVYATTHISFEIRERISYIRYSEKIQNMISAMLEISLFNVSRVR